MLSLFTRLKVYFFVLFLSLGSVSAQAIDFELWQPLGLDVRQYRANPNDRRVVHITSDAMAGWTDVLLELNSQREVHSFRLATSGGSSIEFNSENLKEGAVLKTDQGVGGETLHTVTLQSENFDGVSGGDLKLIYMVSGVPMFKKFAEFEMRLRPISSGQWVFEAGNDGKPFNSMFLRANHLFGKVVGISDVEVSWDESFKYITECLEP